MIGEILDAFCKELQELFSDTGNTVLRSTQFKPKNIPLYTMPVIILKQESSDMHQFIGGGTRADWNWLIGVYNYDFNAELDDDEGYTELCYNVIETVVNHLALKKWLTNDFTTIEETYNFKLTLNGAIKDSGITIDDGSVLVGFGINYESVAIDSRTNFVYNIVENSVDIKGITAYPDTINYLDSVITKLTLSDYNNLTTGVVGGRYWITDSKIIKVILTINQTTYKPSTSETIILNTNDAFFADDIYGKIYIWTGSALLEETVTDVQAP